MVEDSSVAGLDADKADNLDVWVIVRCFNEATVVGDVVAELREYFPHVVGVDDGSADASSEEMLRAGAVVVRHSVNLGAGAALQTGLQYALLDHGARYFLCFDADGQHRAQDAAAMVARLRTEDIDVLIGSRFLGSAEGMPGRRRLLLRTARTFERFSSGIRLTDAHNGLRAFSRRFAIQVDLSMADMAYASELLGVIKHSGLAYAEHPVTINYTDYSMHKGQRSINSVNIAMDIWVHQVLQGRRR
ncbi:MAG: glycosyltransferase family 2 protein [Actinomycetota bacterium]|nr:glycosyltransferase family 2 protein [Actinomycetota bacterium]MDQ2957987.1 glycosyltransferase family 2 protein [Actinomycetota bacterium]